MFDASSDEDYGAPKKQLQAKKPNLLDDSDEDQDEFVPAIKQKQQEKK